VENGAPESLIAGGVIMSTTRPWWLRRGAVSECRVNQRDMVPLPRCSSFFYSRLNWGLSCSYWTASRDKGQFSVPGTVRFLLLELLELQVP
jgi:hypothetical protein